MSNGQTIQGRGKSTVSFRDAAKKAIHDAELQHATAGGKPEAAPTEYELTFHAKAHPGHSLSEYIVVAKGTT